MTTDTVERGSGSPPRREMVTTTDGGSPVFGRQLLDIGERTVFTAAQSMVAVYLAKGSLSVSAAEVAVLTAVAATLTMLRTMISQRIAKEKKPLNWVEDLLSRVAFTFATTLVASLVTLAATPLDMSALKSAVIAALAASLAAVKSAAARGLFNQNNASLVPLA